MVSKIICCLFNELLCLILCSHHLSRHFVQFFLSLLFYLLKTFCKDVGKGHFVGSEPQALVLKFLLLLTQPFQVLFKYFVLLFELLLQLDSLGLVLAHDSLHFGDKTLEKTLQAFSERFLC